jgi:anti-sigma factor RsiW
MKCEQAQSLLLAYLDGEVTPSERILIQTHLTDCTVCQQELELLSTARSRVRATLQQRASQAVPSQDAWGRLESRLTKVAQPSSAKARLMRSRRISVMKLITDILTGDSNMHKRTLLGAGMAVLSIAMVAILLFKTVVPVSAQTILERATAVQAAQINEQGIEHTQVERYSNPKAVEGKQSGTTSIEERYFDPATGNIRSITRDAAGRILQIVAMDGKFNYWTLNEDVQKDPIIIHRLPLTTDDTRKAQTASPDATAESPFEQFRNNPRVELLGRETWADGRQVYVLASRNTQVQNLDNGQEQETVTGTIKMIFDAKTYQYVGNETTVYADGQEIVIEKVRFLVDETLKPASAVDWSLTDLQGVTFVDDPQQQPEEVSIETISEQKLAERAPNAYLLKDMPTGFTLEIVAVTNQPQDQPYAYEIHYRSPSQEQLNLMAVGVMDEGFIETSFYDGSYKSANGLVLNYSSSRPEGSGEGTNAMLTLPDGTSYLLDSTLSRTEVEALVEDMVPIK